MILMVRIKFQPDVLSKVIPVMQALETDRLIFEIDDRVHIKLVDLSVTARIDITLCNRLLEDVPNIQMNAIFPPRILEILELFKHQESRVIIDRQAGRFKFQSKNMVYNGGLYTENKFDNVPIQKTDEFNLKLTIPNQQLYTILRTGDFLPAEVLEFKVNPSKNEMIAAVSGKSDTATFSFDPTFLLRPSSESVHYIYSIDHVSPFVYAVPSDQTIYVQITNNGTIQIVYVFENSHGSAALTLLKNVSSNFERVLD